MIEIKNLKKAAQRIIEAVKNRENIIVYGDADLDGTASVIILQETIKNIGGEIKKVYFPDREVEGYGLNLKALESLKKFAPGLLIVIDCGISNFEETDFAKKLGFEVIIIDHHETLGKLPKANILVDPKQKGDKYPFKLFAAAGLAFKLAQEILGKKMTKSIQADLLELVALATIADMMPQQEDNLELVEKGSRALPNSWRPGIKAFFEMKEVNNNGFEREIISRAVSLLNVSCIENGLPAPYRILTASSVDDAKNIILKLIKKKVLKREEMEFLMEKIEKEINKKSEENIVFEECDSLEMSYLGSLASIVCNKYRKPTFIFKKKANVCRGAVRAPEGLNGVEAMKSCDKLLVTYGGHPPAAGFTVEAKNLEKFKKCLIEYFDKNKG